MNRKRSFLISLPFALLITLFLICFVLVYIQFSKIVSLKEDQLSHEKQIEKSYAIDACMKAATATTDEGRLQRIEPILYVYKLCIEDKGYTTSYSTEE